MSTLKMVGRLTRFRPKFYIIAAVLWNMFLILALVPGLITREILENVTGNSQLEVGVVSLIVLFAVVSIFRFMLTYGAVAAEVTFQHIAGALIRKNMLKQVFKQPGARALNVSSGDAVSRFRDDVDQVVQLSTDAPYVISQFIFSAVAVGVMLSINWYVTICIVLPVLLIVFIVRRSSNLIEKYRREGRNASGRVSEFLGELFHILLTIKVTRSENVAVTRLQKFNEERRKAMRSDKFFSELLNSFSNNTVNIGTGIMLLVASQAMKQGEFTVGDFSLFIYYLYYVTGLPVWLGQFLAQYKQTGVSIERMLTVTTDISKDQLVKHGLVYEHGSIPKVDEPPKTKDDHLEEFEVRNLSYRHSSGRGIANINLKIKRGSLTVITGRIGSGKSTLLRCVAGLLPVNSGSIHWNGKAIQDPGLFFVPPRMSYTSQVPNLFDESIQDNILMGIQPNDERLRKAVHQAVFDKDLDEMEEGLQTRVGSKGVRLSGGQIQRVAAARMFVRNTEMILVDDISSALDMATEQQLWDRLLEQKDITCLAVTHRPTVLERADHVIVLHEGKVQSEGTFKFLMETDEEMKKIWRDASMDAS